MGINVICEQAFNAWVRWVFGLGLGSGPKPKPKTQRDPDSEFNSIHYGIEINKRSKFLIFLRLLKKIC